MLELMVLIIVSCLLGNHFGADIGWAFFLGVLLIPVIIHPRM